MNLSTLTALINAKIRNKTPKVLKVEHADVEQQIVNTIFASTIYDSNSKGLIINETTAATRGDKYFVLFRKIGKTVFFNGQANNKGMLSTNNVFLEIKDTSYNVRDNYDLSDNVYDVFPCLVNGNQNGTVTILPNISGKTVFSFQTINPGQRVETAIFSGNYETEL